MAIKLDYQGKSYKLEFTRSSVELMERRGIHIGEVQNAPLTVMEAIFYGAFLANHRSIRRELTDEIFSAKREDGKLLLGNRTKLVTRLTEMYNDVIGTLMGVDEDVEAYDGNFGWEEV